MGMSDQEKRDLTITPSGPGNGDYSDGSGERQMQAQLAEIEAEKERRRQRNIANGDGDKNHLIADAGETSEAQRRYKFVNPGSANYGGDGGVDYYKEQGRLGGMKNDAAEAQNAAAMRNTFNNLGARGPQAQENAALTGRATDTRGQQMQALDLSRDAAMGNAPSEAAAQTRLGMNDVMGTQAGAMGGARGLSALGGTQAMGSASVGMSAGNLGMQGGLARSKEIGDAIGMYGTQAGTVRDQDQARLAQSNQNGQFNAKLNDDWKMGNASLLAQQGALSNNQVGTNLAWKGEQWRGTDRRFQYDQEMAAKEAGADADAVGARLAKNREDKENKRQVVSGLVAGGMTVAGAAVGGPAGGALGGMAGAAVNGVTKDWDW